MHHPAHKTLRAAYSFYMAATTVSHKQLMQDVLVMAKQVLVGAHWVFMCNMLADQLLTGFQIIFKF